MSAEIMTETTQYIASDVAQLIDGARDQIYEEENEHVTKSEALRRTLQSFVDNNGPSIDAIADGADYGVGRETRYRDFRIVRLSSVECSSDWMVVDCHTRDSVAAFDRDEFNTGDELRDWLNDQHEHYWSGNQPGE